MGIQRYFQHTCDRCKQIETADLRVGDLPNQWVHIRIKKSNKKANTALLCPGCAELFRAWFDELSEQAET